MNPDRRERVDRCPACGSDARADAFEAPPQMAPPGPPFLFATCGECGLLYLADRVPESEIGAYYGGAYLPHRGETAWGPFAGAVRLGRRRMDRDRVERVRALAPLAAGDRVLDVGCGRPTFLAALREATGAHCVGVDLEADAFADEPAFEGLELHAGDPRILPGGAPFRVVTMWHYLEHDYDPVATLRDLLPHAAPDTLLLIEVPDGRSLGRRWGRERWGGLHTPRHTAVYTPDTLGTVLERGGWSALDAELDPTLDPWVLWWLTWRERRTTDWTGSMARYFPAFLLGKALLAPLLGRLSKDVLLVAARPSGGS